MLGVIKSVISVSLFLLYPYLVYRGMESGFVWVAPTLFSAVFLVQAYKAVSFKLKVFKILLALGLLAGAFYLQTVVAKVLPALIQLMLMFVFGMTLMEDKGPPLIERFVRLEFSELPEDIIHYCRHLTWLWVSFFTLNSITCVVLAVWGDNYWWAVFNGLVIYVMIGMLTIAEYIYRHFRFPDLAIPNPTSTIKTMILNGRRIWLEVAAK